MTVHDLSFERFPEYFSLKRRLWHFILNPRKLCQRADKILAVSKSTKHDLTSLYGIKPEKIETTVPIRNIENFFRPTTKEKKEKIKELYALPKKYILYLGTIEPRKNIISLIQAYEQLQKSTITFHDINLVIAGNLGWSYRKTLRIIQKSEFKEQIYLPGFIKTKDKPALYQNAEIFVFPSFFEGFGFPPVEAMASGVPVITSNCSSLPEVVSDAAILIDPYKPNEIFLALQELLGNSHLAQKYQKRGLEKSKKIFKKTKRGFCFT